MNRDREMVCLAVAVMLIMTVIASPSYGANVDVEIKLKNKGSSCEIELKDKRFEGICKSGANDKKCDGDGFSWEVKANPCNNLAEWTLVITNAPDHPACFTQDLDLYPGVVVLFTEADTGPKSSGLPLDECTDDKYGTYWPYVVSLYDGSGDLVETTDPGGIIFP